MTRAERYAQFKSMRENGMKLREIAEACDVSTSLVSDVLLDPTGEKVRERKRRYERPCVDCGRTINRNGLQVGTSRCQRCEAELRREMSRRWIVDSMQEWNATYGAPPSSYDWSPAFVRYKGFKGSMWRVQRYESTGRPWPSPTTVINNFGSWNDGLRAAGFEPLSPAEYAIGHAGVALIREEAA